MAQVIEFRPAEQRAEDERKRKLMTDALTALDRDDAPAAKLAVQRALCCSACKDSDVCVRTRVCWDF